MNALDLPPLDCFALDKFGKIEEGLLPDRKEIFHNKSVEAFNLTEEHTCGTGRVTFCQTQSKVIIRPVRKFIHFYVY